MRAKWYSTTLQTLLGEAEEKELRIGHHFQRFSDARALQVTSHSLPPSLPPPLSLSPSLVGTVLSALE